VNLWAKVAMTFKERCILLPVLVGFQSSDYASGTLFVSFDILLLFSGVVFVPGQYGYHQL
jgi:hypothetical protein